VMGWGFAVVKSGNVKDIPIASRSEACVVYISVAAIYKAQL